MTCPVLEHSSWRHLLHVVQSTPGGRALRSFPKEFLQTALAGPVALARWLAADQPQLLDKAELHLVVAGASRGLDSLDTGRWYQFLPSLLGVDSLKVHVTLVGPELKPGEDFASLRTGKDRSGVIASAAAASVASYPAADIAAVPLGHWWDARAEGERQVDGLFIFHPGLEAFAGSWFSAQEGFAGVHAAGVPIGLTSSCVEELWQEDWLTSAYGYKRHAAAAANPFCLERDNAKAGGQWAGLIWSLSPEGPPVGFQESKPQLMRFYLALDQAKPGFSVAGNAIFGFIGGVVPIQNPETGEQARLVGLPAGVLLCLESGQVLGQLPNGTFALVESLTPLVLDHLGDYPGDEAHPVDRFIWACEKFRGFIEPELYKTGKAAKDSYEELLGITAEAGIPMPVG